MAVTWGEFLRLTYQQADISIKTWTIEQHAHITFTCVSDGGCQTQHDHTRLQHHLPIARLGCWILFSAHNSGICVGITLFSNGLPLRLTQSEGCQDCDDQADNASSIIAETPTLQQHISCKWELPATLPRSQLLIPSWSQAQENERGLDGRLIFPLCKKQGTVEKIQGKMYSVQKTAMV